MERRFRPVSRAGLRKTLTAIALMGRLALDGRIQRALVVAPLAVLPVWEKDMAAYASYPYALRIVHGAAKAKAQAWLDLTEGPGGLLKVMVINYDGMRSAENMTRIAAFAPDMVILDEGQRIKTTSPARPRPPTPSARPPATGCCSPARRWGIARWICGANTNSWIPPYSSAAFTPSGPTTRSWAGMGAMRSSAISTWTS